MLSLFSNHDDDETPREQPLALRRLAAMLEHDARVRQESETAASGAAETTVEPSPQVREQHQDRIPVDKLTPEVSAPDMVHSPVADERPQEPREDQPTDIWSRVVPRRG